MGESNNPAKVQLWCDIMSAVSAYFELDDMAAWDDVCEKYGELANKIADEAEKDKATINN